jgi:hypothetical protein
MLEAAAEKTEMSEESHSLGMEVNGQKMTIMESSVIRGQRTGANTQRATDRAGREGKPTGPTKTTPGAAAAVSKPPSPYLKQSSIDAQLKRLRELSQAAASGETAALDELRNELDRCPHVWRRIADLQYMIECKMADQIAEKDLLKLESLRKRLSELRYELTKESDSLLVKLAVSRYLACWIFSQFVELKLLSSDMPDQWAKLLVQAEQRTATAMRALLLAKKADAVDRQSGSSTEN